MTTSRHSRRGALLRPVGVGWQRWEQAEDGAWSLSGEGAEPAALGLAAGDLLAVPVRRAFSLAVWVPGEDPALFADLVFTQLELRGLAGRSRETTTFAWEVVAEEAGEALLHAVVLPPNLGAQYWHGEVRDYAVSPACLPLEPDSAGVWPEEGGWVSAVKRGDKLLHFQTLAEPSPEGQMALEVWLMLASLEAGGMLAASPRVVLYYDGTEPPDLSTWQASGGLPVESRPLPPPVRPAGALECIPLPVQEVQKSKAAGRRRQKIALMAAAGYFALVLLVAAYTGWLAWRARALKAEVSGSAGAVTQIQATMNTWRELLPALDPKLYPLEVLYQVAAALPEDGVRLTLFQMSPREVMINGEVTSIPVALRFQEAVTQNQDLAEFFDWTSDQVVPTGKSNFKFQMRGVSRVAPATAEEEGTIESADL